MGWLAKWWNSEQQATLRRIASANALVVFFTFYSDWGLSEVSLCYAGELVILMFVVWARVLCARRLPAYWPSRRRGSWSLAFAKVYAILITACMFLLFSGI